MGRNNWGYYKFSEIFTDVSRFGTKLPTREYLPRGKYPIVDQGKDEIVGYTDREAGLYIDTPILVFGDHTRIIKYVDYPFFLGADGVKLLKCTRHDVDYKYLYYCLKHLHIPDTGYNRHFKYLKEQVVPLPPLPEQRRIAAVLDQVSSLIALRKAQLAKLDLLVKARFVEMFGDPVKNEMGWNIVSLDEIAEISSGITKGRKTKEQDLKKVPYLSVSNVKDGYIDVSHVKTILATQNEIKQYKLLPYDVLMTEGGDPDKLGRGAILYQPPENCIHQNHIFRVRFDKNKINPVFFEEYLKHPAAKKYFLKCAKQTTGIATINMKQLSSLPVLLPPLEHQHVFSQFKQDTLKLKLAYNQTLEKLEILMKSLSLEYFG